MNHIQHRRKALVPPNISVLLLCILAVAVPRASYAHGEIVYGARYYLPPGSHGTSHSHIYRIDPDGCNRVQLTFGNSDDTEPIWTDQGNRIEFGRTINPSGDSCTMIMNADGSGLRRVTGNIGCGCYLSNDESPPDNHLNLSPDGKYEFKPLGDRSRDEILDVKSNEVVGQTGWYPAALWLSNSEFAVIEGDAEFAPPVYEVRESYQYTVFNLHGQQKSSILLTDISRKNGHYFQEMQWAAEFGHFTKLTPDRCMPHTYFGSVLGHYTTLYWIDLLHKRIRFITSTDGESWSPDRQRFCTCVFLGPTPYERRREGSWRTVWTADLAVVNLRTLGVRMIQTGAVDCAGADWRGGSRNEYW